jgi:hypothetical protein
MSDSSEEGGGEPVELATHVEVSGGLRKVRRSGAAGFYVAAEVRELAKKLIDSPEFLKFDELADGDTVHLSLRLTRVPCGTEFRP